MTKAEAWVIGQIVADITKVLKDDLDDVEGEDEGKKPPSRPAIQKGLARIEASVEFLRSMARGG